MKGGQSRRRVVLVVMGAHLAVVIFIVAVQWVRGLLRPRPKEYTTLVRLAPLPPAVAPSPAPAPAAPEPPPAAPPPPPSAPPPKPAPAPQAAPKNQIEISRKRIRRPSPEPVRREQPRPPPALDDIREQLALPSAPSSAPAESDLFAVYYAMVRRRMMEAWVQPSRAAAPPGATAQIAIVVERDGRVSDYSLSQSSGNRLLDDSALTAAGSIRQLQALPSAYRGASKRITIDFVLTGEGA